MPRRLLLFIALGLVILVAACASEDPVADAAAPPSSIPDDAADHTGETEVTVEVSDNKYVAQTIIVSPGTDVVWVNVGLNQHNVISASGDDGDVEAFERIVTEVLDDPGQGTRTFNEAGDYPYYCSIHGTATRGQRGRVIVVEPEI